MSQNVSPATVLVVEDNPITRKLYRITLETAGYVVLDAPDGKTALDLMVSHGPDLVLQDLVLPDLDGFDLVRLLRAAPGGTVPVLAVSGLLSDTEQSQVRQHGFTDFLCKPVAPAVLIQTVRAYLPADGDSNLIPLRVVVAHDDPLQLKLLTIHLEQAGFAVTPAEDGAAALEKIRASRPDAIVSDILMPRLDGFRLCQEVRRDAELARLPVLLVSAAFTEAADHDLADQVGASALLPLTPDLREVVGALRRALAAPPNRGSLAESAVAMYTERIARQLDRQSGANAELARRLASIEAELDVVANLAQALGQSTAIEPILAALIHHCADATGISRGAAYLLESDGQLVLSASLGYSAEDDAALRELFGCADLLHRALAASEPLAVPSFDLDAERATDLLLRARARSLLIVPLLLGSERLGVVVMASERHGLEQDRAVFIRVVGGLIGQAIGMVRTMARLRTSEEENRQHRQDAETSLAQLEAVVNSMTEGVLIADLERRIVTANPAAQCLLGFEQGKSFPTRLDDLAVTFDPRDPDGRVLPLDDRPLARVLRGETFANYEAEVRRADTGLGRLFSFNGAPVRNRDGQRMLAVVTLRDVTEQKQAEHLREEYVSLITHDLRNPLTSVMGQAQWLKLALADKGLQREASSADSLLKNARRMNTMLQELVDSIRLEAGQMEIHKALTDLQHLLSETVERVGTQEDRARLLIEVPEWVPPVAADRDRLERAVENLLTNALKFSPSDQPVLVQLTRSDGRAVISVTDQGVGIPAEEVPYLFGRYFRARTGKKAEGLGLGLYVARLIVEAHGGRVSVESVVGKGSTFSFALPLPD